jgi:ABC-2 type transport system permease protein
MKTFGTLLKTELKLSLRGMDMVIFALIMPLVILIIIGIIYGSKPAFEGAVYAFLEQSFGALASIAVCAGGVMGLPLVISDYRGKGILKRFKVTPISPAMLLFVQVVIYAIYALTSLLSLYVTAKLLFGYEMRGSWPAFLGGYALVILSMFSIGMVVGGLSPNIKIAGVLASIMYFPMLIFSGTTLPYEVMPSVMQKAADVLPLTQGIKLLKAASLGQPFEGILIPLTVIAVIAAVCIGVSVRSFKWE